MEKQHLLRKGLTITTLVVAAIFLYFFFKQGLSDLQNVEWQLHGWWFSLSLSLLFFEIMMNVVIWHLITRYLNISLPLAGSFKAWMVSMYGKYIPGKIFHLANRLAFYPKNNWLLAGTGYYLESMIAIINACFLSLFIFNTKTSEKISLDLTSILILLPLLFLAAHPKVINIGLNVMLTLLKKDSIQLNIRWHETIWLMLIYFLDWCLKGLAFYCFIRSFTPIEFHMISFTTGCFALASVAGILAFFAPSGIGVRESVLAVTLSFIMPNPIAVVIAIASRLWTTIAELLSFVIVSGTLKLTHQWDHQKKP